MQVLDHTSEEEGPGIDIRLRNVGSEVSVLTELVFKVEYWGDLTICEGGGGLTSSKRYEVSFPVAPSVGDRIQVPISQEVPRNRADRFVTRIGLEPHDPDEGGYLVYLVSVWIEHDADPNPVDAGRAVLIVPRNDAGASALDYSGYIPIPSDPGRDEFPCYQDNHAILQKVAGDERAAKPTTLLNTPL